MVRLVQSSKGQGSSSNGIECSGEREVLPKIACALNFGLRPRPELPIKKSDQNLGLVGEEWFPGGGGGEIQDPNRVKML